MSYVVRRLADDYHGVVWDLPGLGASSPPANDDYSRRTLSADLNAVLESVRGKPVVLVGHSIGGIGSRPRVREMWMTRPWLDCFRYGIASRVMRISPSGFTAS